MKKYKNMSLNQQINILKAIRAIYVYLIVFVLAVSFSCSDEVISESSLFEGKEMAIKYDIDIINPMSMCRCIEYDDKTVTLFIEGKKFKFMKQDIKGDVGIRDILVVGGDYKDLKEVAIAIKNGDDLIKFVNKVEIILIITPLCLNQIRSENQERNRPGEEIRRQKINN